MEMRNMIHVLMVLWERWDVRGLMLLSLSLQTLLLLLAPLRKRTSNNWVIGTILCLYLLAEWAANFAAGVITSTQGNIKNHKNNQPLAFWSTFLLVHLGGPDSITAFSLQDNDFWHRHALALIFQCISASYIFFQTLPENQLWLPTLLMFVCGFIKYYERTRSLYSASFNNLRNSMRKKPDPGLGYYKMMSFYRAMIEGGLPVRTEMITVQARAAMVKLGELNDREVALYAHRFFLTFKRLVVDLKCSYYERVHSRNFFMCRSSEDAFKVIALELNFMYDILFTKANFVYKRKGFLLRLFSSVLVVTAFGLFYYEEKRFRHSDVAITYALLLGAIALDVIAYIQLFMSYWLTAFTTKLDDANWLIPPPPGKTKPLGKQPFRRWSESVSTHNLIAYCLDLPQPEAQKIMDLFGLSSFYDGLWYVRREPFTDKLRNHIFQEVKNRSELAEGSGIFMEAIKARGSFALHWSGISDYLFHYVDGVDYDQSLLLWHIATELCWWEDRKENDHRDFSKILSDYMLYLVVMQPAIMHGVTDIGQTRLRDTCAEVQMVADQKRKEEPSSIRVIIYACRYLLLFIIGLVSPIIFVILSLFVVIFLPLLQLDRLKRALWHHRYTAAVMRILFRDRKKEMINRQEHFFTLILGVSAEIEPICIKGGESKSVLFDGRRLAQELDKLGDEKWSIMSKVWVEMLTYAAVHCRPRALAEQLSKGGELISFVWLLMAHFGLVDQFEDYGGLVRVKLIVTKT